MTTAIVTMSDVDLSIRAAIRVHIKRAKHPDEDMLLGCELCTALIAVEVSINRDAQYIELPDERAPAQDSP